MSEPLAPPQPLVTPTAQPFWDALAEHRVVVQHCGSCGAWVHYPRVRCPRCGADALVFEPVDGTGRLVSFTVARQPVSPHFAESGPMVIAIVEVAPGARLTTNIDTDDPGALRVGDLLDPVFVDDGDGPTTLRFSPRRA